LGLTEVDRTVSPRSRIARLPRPLRPAATLPLRWLADLLWPAGTKEDGIVTARNSDFRNDPHFKRCYARAIKASGWDYDIRYRVHQALWCSALAKAVQGDFVEIGTGRGFVMSALMEDGVSRPVHLFDTFLPNISDGTGNQVGEQSPHYAAALDRVRENFSEWPNVVLHVGNVFDTLAAAQIERIAFLHVDMNHPDPEEFGIRQLWPKMPKGAVMLLDDYAYKGFERQYDRDNRLAEELGFRILSTPTGQGIVVKS
jgi:hypothetical protein